MNFTEQQKQEMLRAAEAHSCAIWKIRLAARTNNTWSEHRPDNIRKRIAADRALLNEALSAEQYQ